MFPLPSTAPRSSARTGTRVRRTVLLLALLAASAGATNIIVNPSFELWLGNLPVAWVTSELSHPGSAVPDSGSHSGDLCLKLIGSDTSAYATSATIVRPGLHYEFAGWVRCPGIVGGSFVLQFAKINLELIGTPVLIPVVYSGSDYREYGRWVSSPDSAAFILVAFATLPSAAAYLDDVTLDDTTLPGVQEPGIADPQASRTRVRKFVHGIDRLEEIGPGSRVFDRSGRELPDPALMCRFSVYFVLE
ncbi:MAG: hypothetical protein JSU73_13775 [candidate division WOR-3 bacterium]|nr:MAG: hypothetical protein JSU73_13775 [candidate division WOR-3 bacterium]